MEVTEGGNRVSQAPIDGGGSGVTVVMTRKMPVRTGLLKAIG